MTSYLSNDAIHMTMKGNSLLYSKEDKSSCTKSKQTQSLKTYHKSIFSNIHLKHHSNAHNILLAFAVYTRSSRHIVLC